MHVKNNPNWIESSDFQNDSRFLWHAWWIPDHVLLPEYGNGIAELLGRDQLQLRKRYIYWNNRKVVQLRYEGCIEISPTVFKIFETNCPTWREDRESALQNIIKVLKGNVQTYNCPQQAVYAIIRYWRSIHNGGEVACKREADALSLTAGQYFDGSVSVMTTSGRIAIDPWGVPGS